MNPLIEPGRPLVVAHRGASAEAPENTLEAFRLGIEQGADALELDVRLSADEIAVVIHDPSIDRTTNGTGAVAGLTLEELQRADAGGGARIPTLRAVLEAFPTIPILLEVKAPEAQAAVAAEIDRAGARERVVIASFQHRALELLRKGPYLIGADRRDVSALYALGRLHLESASPRCLCYAVPWRWKGKLEVPKRWFIEAARRQQRPVHVWTVDEPAIATLLWARGASGIITNRPAVMRAIRP
ncbi:MAG TPA: glycerophosphodiester phosphodiesterase family protein [Gemmatimonadales bacterium]|nr:glycerophosphodiester phosphodiesterase family protein [Gemmatimonadales bacterium]